MSRFKFDPLFGFVTFERAAKFIAIFDVVICCVYVLSQGSGAGYAVEQQAEKYETDLSKAVSPAEENANVENKLVINPTTSTIATTTIQTPDNDTDLDPLNMPSNHPPIFLITLDDYKKLSSENTPSMDVILLLGICATVFGIAHIIFEVWLCRLLLKAAAHKDGSALKVWFWCRLGVTIMFTLYGLFGIMSMKWDFIDWINEFVNIYRVYTLYIIYYFKSSISACVNIAKPREEA